MKILRLHLPILFASTTMLIAQDNPIISQNTQSIISSDRGGLPGKSSDGLSENQRRYPLQPFDGISVQIFNHEDLSASQRISDVGTIALPLVDEIKVAGLTTTEAQRAIAAAYIDQEYLVNPIVTVTIVSFTPQTVTVLGELAGGGQVQFPDGVRELPIQEVVAKAGDFSDIARSTAVRIERQLPGQEEPTLFVVDVKAIIESTKNNQAVETFMIYPGDIIFVPRRAF